MNAVKASNVRPPLKEMKVFHLIFGIYERQVEKEKISRENDNILNLRRSHVRAMQPIFKIENFELINEHSNKRTKELHPIAKTLFDDKFTSK